MRWLLSVVTLCLWATGALAAASVNVSWQHTTQPTDTAATGFNVYRQQVTGSTCPVPTTPAATGWTKLNSTLIPVATKTYLDTTVTAGTAYCWYATAVAATGKESAPSNAAPFQPINDTPTAPNTLQATSGTQ